MHGNLNLSTELLKFKSTTIFKGIIFCSKMFSDHFFDYAIEIIFTRTIKTNSHTRKQTSDHKETQVAQTSDPDVSESCIWEIRLCLGRRFG